MNILPRFLFLFQMLPCSLPDEFFKSINNSFSRFLWRNKKPRISLATLMKPKALGGLNLPNLQYYFWAAQIRNMISWITMRHESMWVNIEAKLVDPLPLSALPFINQPEKIKKIDRWFTVAHSLQTWKKCRKKIGIPSAISVYSPIFSNPDLKSITFLNTREWIHSGISQLKDVLNADLKVRSFIELKLQFDLQDTQFFKYLQLRSVINVLLKEKQLRYDLTELEDFLISSDTSKGKISLFYNLMTKEGLSSFELLKRIWENDMGESFDENVWLNICNNIHFPFTSNKVK